MKLHKIYKVDWEDAHSEISTTLNKFLESKIGNTSSLGYLVFEDDKKIILVSELDEGENFKSDMRGDFTLIPKGWIKKARILNV